MQTANEIVEQYSLELSRKANKFHGAFGFYPAREGSAAYFAMPEARQNLSFAFFSNVRIRQLETLIVAFGEHCHVINKRK